VYATVRTYSGASGLADELAARADEVRGVIGDIEGFRGYYLIKTGDGAVTVSVFDNEAGAEASTKAAAAYLRENMPDAAGSPPQISSGEVVFSI